MHLTPKRQVHLPRRFGSDRLYSPRKEIFTVDIPRLFIILTLSCPARSSSKHRVERGSRPTLIPVGRFSTRIKTLMVWMELAFGFNGSYMV